MPTLSTTSQYVSWEDLRKFRDEEKQQSKAEFGSLNQSLDSLKQQLKAVNVRLDHLEELVAESDQRKAETLQTMASLRNYTLRNPTLRIHPVPAYIPDRGIVDPASELFPKNAKEFYSLRDLNSDRRRRMLKYLTSFYEVPYESSLDVDSDTSEGDQEFHGPGLAVSMLERILGLNEDNFIRFQTRAQELDGRQTAGTVRRHQFDEPDRGTSRQTIDVDINLAPKPRKRLAHSTLAVRQRSDDHEPTTTTAPQLSSPISGQSDQALVGWGPRSTPSDRRPSIHSLNALGAQARRDNAAHERRRVERMNEITSFESGSPTHSNDSRKDRGDE